MVETKSRRSKKKKPKQQCRGSPVVILKDLATDKIYSILGKGGEDKEETPNNVTFDNKTTRWF